MDRFFAEPEAKVYIVRISYIRHAGCSTSPRAQGSFLLMLALVIPLRLCLYKAIEMRGYMSMDRFFAEPEAKVYIVRISYIRH